MRFGVPLAAVVAASVSLLALGSASASVVVVGGSLAQQCSEAADRGRALETDLTACTVAIQTEALDERNLAGTYVNRGVILHRLGRTGEAVRDFDRAIGMEAHAGEAYVNRGAVLIGQGRFQEGLADTDRALQLGLREPEKAWFNRAVANERLGNAREAYMAYRRAAEISPNWAQPRLELARFTVR